MASSRPSAGTTTRPPPTSTGCAQATRSPSPIVAQVNDGHGNVGAQNLVITITGTNDVPVDRRRDQPGPPISEVAGDSSAQDIPQQQRHHHHHRPGSRRHADVSVTGNATASYKPVVALRPPCRSRTPSIVTALIASGAISFRSAHLQRRAADHRLALQPGRCRPRLAARRRHAHAHLSSPRSTTATAMSAPRTW